MKHQLLIFCLLSFWSTAAFSQEEDLLSLLGEEETIDYTTAAFKTNRVINLHSLENTAAGVFDFKISHRFGFINGGIQELFGLDASTIRIGGDYGISNRLMVGFGRSSYEKTYDVFGKFKFLRQSSGKRNMPFTAALFASSAVKTIPFANPERDNYFINRLYYTFQLILGRKFSDGFSLQVSPTVVHRNLVATLAEKNDVYAVAGAGRIKLSKRMALNCEYIYVLPDQISPNYKNSLSIGFDIETGGHVFQLHFTNSTSMIEKGFITETVGNWLDGDIHFGFNVSRVFTFKTFDHE
ncbi:MAG: hypothetical protein IPN29_15105 [Saprospiraceae bacterium]|nr:hypothetical protein [Saprospiraceae bacterium]